MKTVLSWLIANMGGIVDFCLIVIFEVFLFHGCIPLGEEISINAMAIGGPVLIVAFHGLCLGGYPSKNIIGDIFNFCILAIGYFVAFSLKSNPEYAFLAAYAWGIIPSLALAIIVAVFTANNMYEVVSRRMLYHSSNADMFEMKVLYTFNRFVAAFSSFAFIILSISLLKEFTV